MTVPEWGAETGLFKDDKAAYRAAAGRPFRVKLGRRVFIYVPKWEEFCESGGDACLESGKEGGSTTKRGGRTPKARESKARRESPPRKPPSNGSETKSWRQAFDASRPSLSLMRSS
jgi:hypothetical protein